jgi:transposase
MLMGWTAPDGIVCAKLADDESRQERRPSAMEIGTIGLDIAKSVFQVHGVDAEGRTVVQRRLKRDEVERFFAKLAPTLIGLEACGSSHHWARMLARLGHEVRLMPPAYVKPSVKRNKTDARDAEAICEAVRRPTMRFVPVKTCEQQAARGLHRARELLVRQRVQLGNAIRGLAGEFGLVEREGRAGFERLLAAIQADDGPVPEPLRQALIGLAGQWDRLAEAAREIEDRIAAAARASAAARRLMTIPGVGPITAHAIVCAVPDPSLFRSARDFAAWIGLTPRQRSSGTSRQGGSISKAGDRTLRRLLVLGASGLLRQARRREGRASPWLAGLLGRRPVKVAVVAQAAKTARIAFALLASGESCRAPKAIPA